MNSKHDSPQKPKTIYINLSKAAKQRNSPEKSPDKFRLPLSKLKKTFAKTENVFDKINENKQKRLDEIRESRNRKRMLEEQVQQDLSNEQTLSEEDLYICKKLFKTMDEKNKENIEMSDLKHVNPQSLREVLRVIFYRKEKQSLFDFIYNCWDTGAIEAVKRLDCS